MTGVLVGGPPRSGTTWIAQALGRCEGAVYVHEPDGIWEPYALRASVGLPGYPVLEPGDRSAGLEALWAGVFAGGARRTSPLDRASKYCLDTSSWQQRVAARRGSSMTMRLRIAIATARPLRERDVDHVVAKTVNGCCYLPWIAALTDARVLVVRRFPLNVLSSWKELGHGGDPTELAHLAAVARTRFALDIDHDAMTQLERQAFTLGVLGGVVHAASVEHPDWVTVRHDDLCINPVEGFRTLASSLGLELSDASRRYLLESDRDGTAYRTQRSTAEVPRRWRTRFDSREIDVVGAVLDRFPPEAGWRDWFAGAP